MLVFHYIISSTKLIDGEYSSICALITVVNPHRLPAVLPERSPRSLCAAVHLKLFTKLAHKKAPCMTRIGELETSIHVEMYLAW